MNGVTFKLKVHVKMTESENKKGPGGREETGRETDVDMMLENTLSITVYIAYFSHKYFYRAVSRIQFT